MNITFRPLSTWPGERASRPRRSQFEAGFTATIDLLQREIAHLGGQRVVIELAMTEADIRLDGWPRAQARATHPGVVVSFESKHGPLRYATAQFDRWQDNLRAIALSLEALRKVDRYGVSKHGEQYRGWRQIGSGTSMVSVEEHGRALIREHGGLAQALKATHPDHGGDPADFRAVMAAREAGAE